MLRRAEPATHVICFSILVLLPMSLCAVPCHASVDSIHCGPWWNYSNPELQTSHAREKAHTHNACLFQCICGNFLLAAIKRMNVVGFGMIAYLLWLLLDFVEFVLLSTEECVKRTCGFCLWKILKHFLLSPAHYTISSLRAGTLSVSPFAVYPQCLAKQNVWLIADAQKVFVQWKSESQLPLPLSKVTSSSEPHKCSTFSLAPSKHCSVLYPANYRYKKATPLLKMCQWLPFA